MFTLLATSMLAAACASPVQPSRGSTEPLEPEPTFEYLDGVMLKNRRPLPPDARNYIVASQPGRPEPDRYYKRVGLSRLLSDAQLGYFQRRGIQPDRLYQEIADFGITPEEHVRLEAVGVDFTSTRPFDAFHYTALADLIVEGTITRAVNYRRGIYTDMVLVDVRHVYKDCGRMAAWGGALLAAA